MRNYYNRKGEILEIKSELEYLAKGHCGSVSHNDEIILKEYFFGTSSGCRLSPQIFDILKDIDNNHLIKLFEIYSKIDSLEINRINVEDFIIDAYTAQYYSDNTANALYDPTDYLLDNFNGIEKLINIFTENKIVTADLKRDNVILSHNRIIIIDPDAYCVSRLHKQDITFENKLNLIKLFRSICFSCLNDDDKNRDDIFKKIVFDLAMIDMNSKTEVTYEISKKLKHVKKPIQYLKK